MTLQHPDSALATVTQLDLFDIPPSMAQTEQGMWITHKPVTNVADSGHIEFRIQGNSDYYLDLASTQLYVKAKITKSDGSDLQDVDHVSPTNLWLHSLFSQVDAEFNDKLVTSSSNTYPYRAYLETFFNYGQEALNTKLTAECFYKDTPGQMDNIDPTSTITNTGLKKCNSLTKTSKSIEMIGGLHLDIMHMSRYLLNNVTMRLRLTRAKNEFCLMGKSTDDYKVVLQDISLDVRRIRVAPVVINSHAAVLLRGKAAKYPLRRTDIISFSVSQGQLNTRQDNLFLGQLPQELVIGIVDSRAYNGAYDRNPFDFQHYDVNYIGVSIDGHQLVKTGNLRLEIKFAKALPHTVNVVVLAEFQNLMQMDMSRSVLFDFVQ